MDHKYPYNVTLFTVYGNVIIVSLIPNYYISNPKNYSSDISNMLIPKCAILPKNE